MTTIDTRPRPAGAGGSRREAHDSPAAGGVGTADASADPGAGPDADGFPGCFPIRVTREQMEGDFERRVEYWDAATEIAMVCEPVTHYHEHPSQRLAQMTTLIALTRGEPIETFGASDLLLRDEHGRPRRVLEADQAVYVDPQRDRPADLWIVVRRSTSRRSRRGTNGAEGAAVPHGRFALRRRHSGSAGRTARAHRRPRPLD